MSNPEQDLPRRIEAHGASAAQLLSLLAYLAPQPLPLVALEEAGEELPADLSEGPATLASNLAEGALLSFDGESVSFPEDLATALRDRHEPAAREKLVSDALDFLYSAFPADPEDVRSWERCEPLLPHVAAALRYGEDHESLAVSASRLLNRTAEFHLARGEFVRAHELARRAQDGAELVADDPLHGTALRTLGAALSELDEIDAAREFLSRAIASHAKVLEPADPELRRDRVDLAEALAEADELDEAHQQLREAIDAPEEGLVDRSACSAYRLLGWVLLKQDDVEASRAAYDRALELVEGRFGPEHPDTAEVRNGLGELFNESDEVHEARRELEAALEIAEAALGDGHPKVAVYCSNLGAVLRRFGEFGRARLLLERALEIGEATLPDAHRALWIRRHKLTWILIGLRDLDSALQHATEVSDIAERVEGSDLARKASDLAMLAAIHRLRGEHTRARDEYQEAIEVAEAADDESGAASNSLALAQIQKDLGELAKARQSYGEALRRYEQLERDNDAQFVVASRIGLAEVLVAGIDEAAASSAALGRDGEAEEMRESSDQAFAGIMEALLEQADARSSIEVADACLERHGGLAFRALEVAQAQVAEGDPPERLAISSAWQRLGRNCRKNGDRELARDAFERSLSHLDDYPVYQGILHHDIGDLLYETHEFAPAAEVYREAAELKRAPGRDGDPRGLGITLYALGRSLEEIEDFDGAVAAYEERLEVLASLPDQDPLDEGQTLHSLADVRRAEERIDEAITLYREAVDRKREAANPWSLASTLNALGRILKRANQLEGGEAAYLEQIEILTSLEPQDPQAEGVARHDLADICRAQDRVQEAAELYGEAAELKREAGVDQRDLALTLNALGRARVRTRDYEQAEQAFQERLEILANLSPREPQMEGVTLHDLAETYKNRKMPDEAAEYYRKSVDRKREGGGEGSPPRGLVSSLMALASVELERGSGELTKEAASQAVQVLRSEEDPDQYHLASALVLDAAGSELLEEPEVALALYRDADGLMSAMDDPNRVELAALKLLIAAVSEELDQGDSAEKAERAAGEELAKVFDSGEAFKSWQALPDIFTLCMDSGAVHLAEKAVAHLRSLIADGEEDSAMASALADMLRELGSDYEESRGDGAALEAYEEARETLSSLAERDPLREGRVLHRIAALLTSTEDAIAVAGEALELLGDASETLEERAALNELIAQAYEDLGDSVGADKARRGAEALRADLGDEDVNVADED